MSKPIEKIDPAIVAEHRGRSDAEIADLVAARAEAFRALIYARGVNVNQLVEWSGVRRTTLSRLINGESVSSANRRALYDFLTDAELRHMGWLEEARAVRAAREQSRQTSCRRAP